MLKLLKSIILPVALVWAAATGAAHAVVVELAPAAQTAEDGDTVTVTLQFSGLTDGGPDSVGEFDVDILFDDSVLTFVDYTLASDLGDPLFDQFDLSLGDLGGGLLEFASVSFLSPTDLDGIQGATVFALTMEFMVDNLALGSSTIVSVDQADMFLKVGDAFGDAFTITGFQDAVIANVIPVPGALPLFLTALFGLGLKARSRKKASSK